MSFLKVVTFLLVAVAVGAEKKIELQDIEEDNLRSEIQNEKEKELDKSDSQQLTGTGSGPEFNPLELMKSGLLKYFDNSAPGIPPQPHRYVHQYAVTEQPERFAPPLAKAQYGPPGAQHAMVGYLSNIPMQIYLVPQYFGDQFEQPNQPQVRPQYQPQVRPQYQQQLNVQYQQPSLSRLAGYQPNPEAVQSQTNYVEVPAYVPPTGKTFVQQYAPPSAVTYVTYPTAPTVTPTPATIAPVVTYQVPVIQYHPGQVAHKPVSAVYYQNPEYADMNSLDDVPDHGNDQKQYSTQTEAPYHSSTPSEFPRHYNSRAPIREDYRHHSVPELPHPNPLLLKGLPSHLSHLPKSLPMYRPLLKSGYQGNGVIHNPFTPRPHDHYGPSPYKRRPSSLLDSYIPSSLQVEYLKRGLVKEPLHAYDALASGRLPHPIPQRYERGFLPNQMYHTGAGGVTYGHYKRTPKTERIAQK